VFSLASTSKVVFFTGRKLFGVMFKNLVWCELLLNCNPSTWLNRLNNETKYGGVPFYILIPDLLQETDIFEHSVRDDDLKFLNMTPNSLRPVKNTTFDVDARENTSDT
jgi:hypothetical protein